MNLKRAIGIGVLTYVISFILGTIVGQMMGIDFSTAETVPTNVWLVNIVISLLLTALMSIWYFNKVTPNHKEGALLGLVFVATGFVIDIILIVPWILLSDSPASIGSYYGNPLFWLTLVLIVATATLVGKLKSA